MQDEPSARRIVLVTGPSGAGRSSALRVLEDLGFESIDNMPLRLLKALIEEPSYGRDLALGIDPRTRDFSVAAMIEGLRVLGADQKSEPELLYLECGTDVLLRRYSETRRRHPLADRGSPLQGITSELEILAPLREIADILIDTSQLNVHELRAEIEHWFSQMAPSRLAVSIQSFSYKRSLPRSVDMIFDCRFLKNPYWDPSLRHLTGKDEAVVNYIAQDARYEEFKHKVGELCLWLLPAYLDEGKSHLSIAFGCTGGQHRSVVLAEHFSLLLNEQGWNPALRHRELDRHKKNEA